MLWFYCARPDDLEQIRREGVTSGNEGGVALWTTLEEARAACSGKLLVVEAAKVESETGENGRLTARSIPGDAFLNAVPYVAPRPVTAAGGLIVRPGPGGPEVLLIFRRGAWDLPKGKRDRGESIEQCALREVREEVGVRSLEIVATLGTTVHGYVENAAFVVKTTHWFLMHTPETEFTPQEEEQIERVEWVPWSRATERIGYDTLRQFIHEREQQVPVLLQERVR